jgi:hypothetical protein
MNPYKKPELKRLNFEDVPEEVKAEFDAALAEKAMLEDYSGVEKRGSGIDHVKWAMVLIMVIFVSLFVYIGFTYDPKAKAEQQHQAEQDSYEEVYNQCMSRETIEADYCHQIALCSVWGCNGE